MVESVGEGVQKWKAGDRVMALLDGGGYAEKAVALEGLVMPLPDHLSFEQGAAIPEVRDLGQPSLMGPRGLGQLLTCARRSNVWAESHGVTCYPAAILGKVALQAVPLRLQLLFFFAMLLLNTAGRPTP